MKLNVIVTCAGVGHRFRSAGYDEPKFLIKVLGKPVISYVTAMFQQGGLEPSFTFVVRDEDLADSALQLQDRLAEAAGDYPWRVVSLAAHRKGPVFTVQSAYQFIEDDAPVIVSYCDINQVWNAEQFLAFNMDLGADASLVTHTGFHPHRLNNVSFAFLRTDGDAVLEIKEKASFTSDPMSEPASTGIYYFRTGRLLKHYCDLLIEEGVTVNGEFYVTLVQNLMIRDGLRVVHYLVDNFWGFGTPEDLENCAAWLTICKWGQIKTEQELVDVWRYWQRVVKSQG